jgi:hypothetical protein
MGGMIGSMLGGLPIVGGMFSGQQGGGGYPGGGASSGSYGSGGYGAGGYAPGATPGYSGINPYAGQPGGQPGGANPMQGLDFTRQGAGESFYDATKSNYTTPGSGEAYSANVMDRYGNGSTPTVSNNAQGAYSQFQSSTPANIAPYYDNAIRQGNEDIRQTMASKGSYGSSFADDQSAEMVTNLRAQQAKDEAGYGLQRAGMSGQLAQGADASSRGVSDNERGWMGALGDIAFGGQGLGMSRLGQGQGAAGAAQDQQRTRGQDYFNNAMMTGDRFAGLMAPTYDAMIGGDVDLMGNQIGLATGLGTEAQNQDYRNTERFMSDMERTNAMMGGGGGKKGK